MPKKNRRSIIASRLKAYATIYVNLFGTVFNKTLTVIRGNWASSSDTTYAVSTSSDYSIASAKMARGDVDLNLYLNGSGTGIAFWITDANNWWALTTDQTSTNNGSYCSAGGTYYYQYYNNYSYSCVTSQYCRWNNVNKSTTCNNQYGVCYGENGPFTGSAYACNAYATEYIYNRNWKLIRAINNVVSAIQSATLESISSKNGTQTDNLGKLSLFLRNTNTTSPTISAKAYKQEANGTYTQLGTTMTHNPTGVNVLTSYGIMASPSAYQEKLQLSQILFTTKDITVL